MTTEVSLEDSPTDQAMSEAGEGSRPQTSSDMRMVEAGDSAISSSDPSQDEVSELASASVRILTSHHLQKDVLAKYGLTMDLSR